MIKVGVIGHGYSAKTFHLPLIETIKSLELVAISTSQIDVVKQKYPALAVFDSADDLITYSDVDLVVITAPNSVHYSLAKRCLEQGKHVVLEKPMVTTSSEATALVELAKQQSCILSVFHNRRWDGDFLTVKKLLRQNILGDIRFFESHYDRFRPNVRQRWREEPGCGTGIWFDLGSHLVDQAICVFGLPESLTARCLALRENSSTTDYFNVTLHYKNTEVVLHASSFAAGPALRFRLEGTKGCFVKYGFDPQETQLKIGIVPDSADFGVEKPDQYGIVYHETESKIIATETGCYSKYYDALADAILGNGEQPVACVDALNVIKIIELAELSHQQGKTLPFSDI